MSTVTLDKEFDEVQQVLKRELTRFSDEQKAALLDILLQSLDDSVDFTREWIEEADKRVEAHEHGESESSSLDEVELRLKARMKPHV